jgi:hypothetical protein
MKFHQAMREIHGCQRRNLHTSCLSLRQRAAWSTSRFVPSRLSGARDPSGDEKGVGRHDQADDRDEDQAVLDDRPEDLRLGERSPVQL